MCLNLNDCQFKTGTSNYQSTDQKLTIDTQKLKRKRPKDNIKIIKSQWKRLKTEELQKALENK